MQSHWKIEWLQVQLRKIFYLKYQKRVGQERESQMGKIVWER